MRLTRMTNGGRRPLKTVAFDEVLQPGVQVWAGPNGAGKSTRLMVPMATAHGVAETNTSAAQDYIGPGPWDAVTRLEFDLDGRTVVLERDHSHGLRTGPAKMKAAEAERLLGTMLVRWDLADFVSATPAVRRKVLDEAARAAQVGGSWDPEVVVGRMRSHEDFAGQEATPLDERLPADLSTLGTQWLDVTAAWAKKQESEASASKRGAKSMLERLRTQKEPTPRGTLKQAKTRLAQAQEAAAEFSGGATNYEAEHATWSEVLARHNAQADRYNTAISNLEADEARLLEALSGPVLDLEEWTAKVAALQSDLDEARATLRVLERDAQDAPSTPEVEGWSLVGDVWAMPGEATVSIGGGALIASGDVAVPLSIVRHLLALHDAQGGSTSEADVEAARSRVERLERRLSVRKARCDAAGEQDRNRERLQATRKRLEDGREHVQSLGVVISEHQQAEPARPAQQDEARAMAARAELRDAQANHDAHVTSAANAKAMRGARADLDTATTRWRQCKTLRKLCEEERALVAAQAFKPIEQAADDFLRRVDPTLSLYIESEDELGLVMGETRVGLWGLSTGQRALFAVALISSLARVTGRPWKVVSLDNFQDLDERYRWRVLEALRDMLAEGLLDDVHVAWTHAGLDGTEPEDVALPPTVPEGVHLHWLGGA